MAGRGTDDDDTHERHTDTTSSQQTHTPLPLLLFPRLSPFFAASATAAASASSAADLTAATGTRSSTTSSSAHETRRACCFGEMALTAFAGPPSPPGASAVVGVIIPDALLAAPGVEAAAAKALWAVPRAARIRRRCSWACQRYSDTDAGDARSGLPKEKRWSFSWSTKPPKRSAPSAMPLLMARSHPRGALGPGRGGK